MRNCIGFILAALLLPMLARGAEPAPKGAQSTAAEQIEPFMRGSARLMVHVDLDRLDLGAVMTYVQDHLPKAAAADPGIAGLFDPLRTIEKRLVPARAAGIHDLYVLLDYTKLPGGQAEPILVVPLAPDLKVPAAQAWMGTLPWPRKPVIEMENGGGAGAVVMSAAQGHKMVAPPSPMDPDVSAALQSLSPAAIQVVLVPTADQRRVFASMLPDLPPALGGGSSEILTHIRYVTLTLQLPPQHAAELRVQVDSAEHAVQIADLAKRTLSVAEDHLKHQQLPADLAHSVELFFKAAQPTVHGTTITIALRGDDFATLVPGLIIPLEQARAHARAALSAANIHVLLQSFWLYGQDHHDQFPPSLDDPALRETYGVAAGMLINPRFPNQKPGYIYVGANVNPIKAGGDPIVLYENLPASETSGDIVVGFADGHVQIIQNAAFEKLLHAQEKAAATQAR